MLMLHGAHLFPSSEAYDVPRVKYVIASSADRAFVVRRLDSSAATLVNSTILNGQIRTCPSPPARTTIPLFLPVI